MPTLEIDYGIFGGQGLIMLILGVIALLILLVVIVLIWLQVKAQRHAKECYESVVAPDANGVAPGFSEMGHRMYVLLLRWLELKKLERHSDETMETYAQRVDQTLQTEASFAKLLPILQKCEFSDRDIIEDQYRQVRLYFDELYRRLHQQKGKLSWWNKLKI